MAPKNRPIKNKNRAEIPLTSNPPSHPHEYDPQHRAFLKRSLDRSDNELAAIQTLHRSLRSLKAAIVEKYGTAALLDIAEGLISISEEDQSLVVPDPDDDDSSFYTDENFQALAKDYLLRLKLRRKLLNRIARRIMRLSQAMDGRFQKVVPPPTPKYGEIRLLSSCEQYQTGLKAFQEDFEMRDEVKKRVDERIKAEEAAAAEEDLAMEPSSSMTEPEAVVPVKDENDAKDSEMQTETQTEGDVNNKDETKVKEENEFISADKSESDKKEDENGDMEVDTGADKSESDKKEDENGCTDMEIDTNTETPAPEPEPVISAPTSNPLPPLLLNKDHQADLEKLIEYDTEYVKTKTTHIPTSTTFVKPGLSPENLLRVEKIEEDFEYDPDTVARGDIGAANRGMSLKEKVMEWKRWQTQFLGKIPDQPTFEDLGMKSQVFCLKERRELILKGQTEKEEVNEQELDQDQDQDQKNDKVKTEDNDGMDKENKTVEEFVKKKAFSVDPIPSFHDQDYHRCLMIHSDLITNSLKENARKNIAQSTVEYNNAFRMSSEYQTQKIKIESEQKKALLDYRVKLELWTTSRTLAYAKWENEKKIFEAQLMARKRLEYQSTGRAFTQEHSRAMQMDDDSIVRRALSGAVDRVVIRNAPKEQARGTEYTSSLAASGDTLKSLVATSLAHCVDAVVNRIETGWISNSVLDQAKSDTFPLFKYPNNPRTDIVLNEKGETLEKLQARITQQLQKVSKHLTTCETVRSQKWSKLMKAKQEAEGSTASSVQAPPRKSYATNRVQPVANTAPMRSQMNYSQMAASAKVTGMHPRPSSDSKYSAEAVKARMSADGSVRPINMPKQTKDGLYLRPAGRQRKGMDWDAINGRWVPQGSLMPHH
jgi:hypothetical protein